MRLSSFRTYVDQQEWPLIDFLRIGAALLVVTGHTRFLYFGTPHDVVRLPLWTVAVYFVFGLSHEAVVLFFVISGFLVGGPAAKLINERKFDAWTYLINRFSRIYLVLVPALILAFVLDRLSGAVLSGTNPHRDLLDGWSDFNVACHLVSLQGLACFSHADPPLWSLGYEWLLYLVGPVCIAIVYSPLDWVARSIAMMMLVLIALVVLPDRTQWQLLIAWFAGVAAYLWRAEVRAPFGMGVSGLVLMFAGCVISRDGGLPLFASDSIIVGGLILTLGCNTLMTSTFFNSSFSIFAKPARFSYSLYAIHLPVVVMCARLLEICGVIDGKPALNISNGMAFVISVCVALLAAAIFSRATEAKTGRVRRAIQARRRARELLVLPSTHHHSLASTSRIPFFTGRPRRP